MIEAVTVGALLAVRHNTESSYAYHLELAQKYLLDGEYEEAIAEFSAAIEISPKKEDAYTGMADAYIAMGDYESAVEILNEGYDATASKTVKRKLKSAKDLLAGADEVEESVSEVETLTATSEIEDEIAETVSEQESSGVQDGEAYEASGEFEYAERATYDEIEVEDENNIAEGSYEGVRWWIDSDGVLYVEGTGDFSSSTGCDRVPWYSNRASITGAIVNLTGATNLSYMFDECRNMKSIDLSGLDTGSVTNMSFMFSSCTGLESLDLSGFETENVTDMSAMFFNCRLKSIDVGGFDTSNVTNMSEMFNSCDVLESIDLSSFDTSSVTDMGWMFEFCSELESIDLSSFDTSSVINMNMMFAYCSGLESIDLSGFDTSSVTEMWYMFEGCSGLKTLNMTGCDLGNVATETEIGIFAKCTVVTTIYTPKNLSVSVSLPTTSSADAWYMPDGTVVTELPQNLPYSVVLKRQ